MFCVIDILENKIVFNTKDEETARNKLYELRKNRYINDHPDRPLYEYDMLKIDNGYNLFKLKLVG